MLKSTAFCKACRVQRSTLIFLTMVASLSMLQGCTVLAIADTVGSVAVSAAGVAADAAIGTVKITGKAVGAVADAVIPSGESKK
jgi:phage tail tape-measure protein